MKFVWSFFSNNTLRFLRYEGKLYGRYNTASSAITTRRKRTGCCDIKIYSWISHKALHKYPKLDLVRSFMTIYNPLSANPRKWSNTLKQFVGKLPTNCLSVFDHFKKFALKRLKPSKVLLENFSEWQSLEIIRRWDKLHYNKRSNAKLPEVWLLQWHKICYEMWC